MSTFRTGGFVKLCFVLLLAALAGVCACSKKKEAAPPEERTANVTIERTMMAPDVSLRSLDGSAPFISDYKRKIVLLNFWATWNVDCREQIKALTEIAEEYERYQIVVLGVAIDEGGAGALSSFLQTNQVKYPVFYNGAEVAAKFGGVRKLPTTFFIARDGRIYEKVLGARTKSFYRMKIKEIMSQRL